MLSTARAIACGIGRLLGAGCPSSVEINPVTDLLRISRSEFLAEMAKVGIAPIDLGTLLDSIMTITTEIELERIAPYLVYPADWYIEQIADCEDYALQAQCDAAFKFHVSGIRMGLGWMPLGYHGFPITLSKEGGIWLLDPNAGFSYAGEWFKIGGNGYNPNKVFA
jgi:hypothetical protein